MNRLIEAFVLAMCSPWTSVAVSFVSALALGAALVLRASGDAQ